MSNSLVGGTVVSLASSGSTAAVHLTGVTASGAAIHQMPGVITRPKVFVTQPSAVYGVASNGPAGSHSTVLAPNGAHQEIKVLKDTGESAQILQLLTCIYSLSSNSCI